jgi:hypothetical protein
MRATMRRLVRLGLAAGLATTVAVPVLAESAYAKGKPAKVTLFCPSGENATGTVTLQASIFGPPASSPTPVTCTSGQTSTVSIHPISQPAPDFSYSIAVTGTSSGGCFGAALRGGGPIPCFAGVTLTVT